MKKLRNLWIFTLIIIIAAACSQTNTGPFEAAADAYFLSKVRGDSVVVGAVYYAFGNKPISSGKVTNPVQQTVQLNKTIESGYTIFYEPYETDFDTIYPPQGIYTFDLESVDGDKLQLNDELIKVGLKIPEFDTVVYEPVDQSYDISWETEINVDAYKVNLFNDFGEVVFVSEILGNVGTFTLVENDNGTWFKGIGYSQRYTIQLQAMNFDDDFSVIIDNPTSQQFNIQEMAIAEKSFYWNRTTQQ